jgi:hypothetical protein
LEDRPRVAVLLLATGDLDPTTADGLTELLIGALAARGGVRILGREEFQAQLGQGDAGTLDCISSMACMGRVGVQLDVVEVIAGTLAQRSGTWTFNLNRVDVRRGELAGRVFRDVEGDLGAVADALQAAIPQLYERLEPLGAIVIESPTSAEILLDGELIGSADGSPFHLTDVSPGPHEVRVQLAGYIPWSRVVRVASGAELHLEARLVENVSESIHPLVWIGGGVAAAALAAAIVLGVSSQSTWEVTLQQRLSGDVTRAELAAYYDTRQTEAIAADILFGVAGAAAIASMVAIFFPERRRVSGGQVSLLPAPGGATLLGRF